MKKIIIILGVPGSGKGTQAKRICAATGYAHISTGDLLRALAQKPESELSTFQQTEFANMKAGIMVADGFIYELAFGEIQKHLDEGTGVVLDGAVRNVAQAEHYQQFFTDHGWTDQVLAIEIAIADETVMKRLEIRLANEGTIRPDDNPETMKKRLQQQGNEALRPVAEYYDNIGFLRKVDGEPPIDEVTNAIQAVLLANA